MARHGEISEIMRCPWKVVCVAWMLALMCGDRKRMEGLQLHCLAEGKAHGVGRGRLRELCGRL
ncbi:hypothetical protein [Oryza sativa Japonica Group]|uniref:Uncharacterized protein n=1 Tax=Oryza sativa subsp. japonica TaxID=39947 RepID=Q5JLT0_ORYSJ|nr:hypothetical protein [Oryza sativa Japonica Group]BAD87577.1 hypothetical protein [Oryza sativa Japonica Group]